MRFLYEEIFEDAYSFRILVEAAPASSEMCINTYIDGIGFINRRPNSNFSPEQLISYETGKKYEQLYIEAVVYLWTEKNCDKSTNQEFVSYTYYYIHISVCVLEPYAYKLSLCILIRQYFFRLMPPSERMTA